ncbi:hypothetical protein Sj15T_09830 [Sphingobium sp. TA15]|uniref:Uncharacterized protein n=1 Tax=Sphingobium indicum (strain DSM 16413 / CCM 7287 / MTCC 6362 / UT26 / NBRC 101211 / UT26S) TaxID=452662 RepID=D4Z248_SPHIU|nr:hypothetical protein [Sphingobium indicum]BAI96680.1 hypothetical protein SJA_C1-18460 [Sphingobium indicum UT26S]BDD65962.1 hypothetical protein Sj15T_09830 [Sphingobium sp. TA15]
MRKYEFWRALERSRDDQQPHHRAKRYPLQSPDLKAVANDLIAKAGHFRKVFDPNSKTAPELGHAAVVLLALLRERDELSVMSSAALRARDEAGIPDASPAEAIAILNFERRRLQAENERFGATRSSTHG